MRFWRTWQMVTVCSVLTAAGLLAWRYLPGPPTRHFEGDGPLSASTGHGHSFLVRPEPRWYGAFAGNTLCLTDPGEPATITRVRHEVVVEPLSLRTLVRTVDEHDVATEAVHRVRVGTAGYPERRQAARELAGTISTEVAGTVVRTPCSTPGPDEGFTELVFEVGSDRRGAFVPRTFVDYTRGGRAYTLVVDWGMGICGSRIAREVDPEACRDR